MSINETAPPDKLTAAADGPWGYEPIPDDAHTDPDIQAPPDERFWIVDGNGEVIAAVYVVAGREAEAEANARLLGAAQHLLAELKEVGNLSRSVTKDAIEIPRDEWRVLINRIDAIVAAAEGR